MAGKEGGDIRKRPTPHARAAREGGRATDGRADGSEERERKKAGKQAVAAGGKEGRIVGRRGIDHWMMR